MCIIRKEQSNIVRLFSNNNEKKLIFKKRRFLFAIRGRKNESYFYNLLNVKKYENKVIIIY